jgi:hypothetical protein
MDIMFTAIKRVFSYSLLIIFCSLMVSSSTTFADTTSSNSVNWSGYVATGHTFTKVQGDITVPTVTCTVPNAQTFFWVGLDGYNDSTLEQVGVGAECSGATHPTVSYFGWWEMVNGNSGDYIHKIATSQLHVAPGNRVAAIVAVKPGSNDFDLELDNTTVKQPIVKLTEGGFATKHQTAEWIVERPKVNGQSSSLARWTPNASLFAYAEATSTTNSSLRSISYYNNTSLFMTSAKTNYNDLDAIGSLTDNGTTFGINWEYAN